LVDAKPKKNKTARFFHLGKIITRNEKR